MNIEWKREKRMKVDLLSRGGGSEFLPIFDFRESSLFQREINFNFHSAFSEENINFAAVPL